MVFVYLGFALTPPTRAVLLLGVVYGIGNGMPYPSNPDL
jgi:hypothetical protein